jgi:hypothetical protein
MKKMKMYKWASLEKKMLNYLKITHAFVADSQIPKVVAPTREFAVVLNQT